LHQLDFFAEILPAIAQNLPCQPFSIVLPVAKSNLVYMTPKYLGDINKSRGNGVYRNTFLMLSNEL